jgi:hypothetical protein
MSRALTPRQVGVSGTGRGGNPGGLARTNSKRGGVKDRAQAWAKRHTDTDVLPGIAAETLPTPRLFQTPEQRAVSDRAAAAAASKTSKSGRDRRTPATEAIRAEVEKKRAAKAGLVPGFHFQGVTDTGADVRRARELLDEMADSMRRRHKQRPQLAPTHDGASTHHRPRPPSRHDRLAAPRVRGGPPRRPLSARVCPVQRQPAAGAGARRPASSRAASRSSHGRGGGPSRSPSPTASNTEGGGGGGKRGEKHPAGEPPTHRRQFRPSQLRVLIHTGPMHLNLHAHKQADKTGGSDDRRTKEALVTWRGTVVAQTEELSRLAYGAQQREQRLAQLRLRLQEATLAGSSTRHPDDEALGSGRGHSLQPSARKRQLLQCRMAELRHQTDELGQEGLVFDLIMQRTRRSHSQLHDTIAEAQRTLQTITGEEIHIRQLWTRAEQAKGEMDAEKKRLTRGYWAQQAYWRSEMQRAVVFLAQHRAKTQADKDLIKAAEEAKLNKQKQEKQKIFNLQRYQAAQKTTALLNASKVDATSKALEELMRHTGLDNDEDIIREYFILQDFHETMKEQVGRLQATHEGLEHERDALTLTRDQLLSVAMDNADMEEADVRNAEAALRTAEAGGDADTIAHARRELEREVREFEEAKQAKEAAAATAEAAEEEDEILPVTKQEQDSAELAVDAAYYASEQAQERLVGRMSALLLMGHMIESLHDKAVSTRHLGKKEASRDRTPSPNKNNDGDPEPELELELELGPELEPEPEPEPELTLAELAAEGTIQESGAHRDNEATLELSNASGPGLNAQRWQRAMARDCFTSVRHAYDFINRLQVPWLHSVLGATSIHLCSCVFCRWHRVS